MKSKIKLLSLILALSMVVVACGQKSVNTTVNENDPVQESRKEELKKAESSKEEIKNAKESLEEETNSSKETQAEESKDETQAEESKEETQAENNTPAEPGKFNVDKKLEAFKDVKQLKPFSSKLTSSNTAIKDGQEQKIEAESTTVFDGKTQKNEVSFGQNKIVSYVTLEGDKAVVISGMGSSAEGMQYTKGTEEIADNFGIDFGSDVAKDIEWKFEGANGNIEKYTKTFDAKELEKQNDETTQYKDTKGTMTYELEFDTSTQNIHSLKIKGQYETTLVMKMDEKSDPVENKLNQKIDVNHHDFKYDGIETVQIPEEAKKAQDLDAMMESFDEQLKELDKSLEDLNVPESEDAPTDTKAE